jgi:hypothetical protein
MARGILRSLRPYLEACEHRELLSAITDMMAVSSLAAARGSSKTSAGLMSAMLGTAAAGNGGFVPSKTSIAIPSNQSPPSTSLNLALTPTGTLTHRQLQVEKFVAKFWGPYTIGAGRTSTEAKQTFITGVGTSNTMLHCDIQMLIITPKDPSTMIGGVSGIFDRNLNTNTSLGFDLLAPQQDVDRRGRPIHLPTVSLDVNASAGFYTEGFAQGIVNIRYIPNGKHTPGVIDQGTAVVTIHAQIYTPRTNFLLRNANLDA